MRTYSELQSWHYKQIEDSGFKIGDKIWFENYLGSIIEGVIKEFKLHWSGEDMIMVRVLYDDNYEITDPPNVWDVNGQNINKHKSSDEDDIYINSIASTKEQLCNNIIVQTKKKIGSLKSEIEYYENKIKEI